MQHACTHYGCSDDESTLTVRHKPYAPPTPNTKTFSLIMLKAFKGLLTLKTNTDFNRPFLFLWFASSRQWKHHTRVSQHPSSNSALERVLEFVGLDFEWVFFIIISLTKPDIWLQSMQRSCDKVKHVRALNSPRNRRAHSEAKLFNQPHFEFGKD